MARRRHRRRKNPLGEDLVIGLIGAGMGALITYFYVNSITTAGQMTSGTPATTTTGSS
jgi:hypothetical protein